MTTALMRYDAHLDLLCDAALLCEVCQEVPWTQTARQCDALVCADCAQGEPDTDEETRHA